MRTSPSFCGNSNSPPVPAAAAAATVTATTTEVAEAGQPTANKWQRRLFEATADGRRL